MIITQHIDSCTKEAFSKLDSSYLIKKDLQVRVYQNVVLVPNRGIFYSNGKMVSGTHFYDWVEDLQLPPIKSYNEIEEAVFVGCLHTCWGHSLTDSIRRMWFLQDSRYDFSHLPYLCLIEAQGMVQNQIDLINCIIPFERITSIQKPTYVKKLHIPDYSFSAYNTINHEKGFYTQQYQQLREIIIAKGLGLPYLPTYLPTYEKIYFSRSEFKGRKVEIGEKSIEEAFVQMGFTVLHPEKLSFVEQCYYLQNCTHFATTEGTPAHNIFFCKPHTSVIIIKKYFHVNTYQHLLNEISNANIIYIDAHLSCMVRRQTPEAGPAFMYRSPHILQYALDNFNVMLDDKPFPLAEFKQYILHALNNQRRIPSPRYYYTQEAYKKWPALRFYHILLNIYAYAVDSPRLIKLIFKKIISKYYRLKTKFT